MGSTLRATSAFVGIDRHGHITGGLVPDSVTRAVKRISARAGVPISWTGHSLRIGLASTGRKRGKDAIAIADQGGWARRSRSMLGYMRREDGWDDNAPAGLTRKRCARLTTPARPSRPWIFAASP
ncbi:hypothetical protein [Streptomyces virginiae]|uniref:hypothetical protein n=1 Tax=Streptomyces virginiae TaxID=1961 RepID=UPI002F913CD4|nr:hypothetical protein OG253_41920 [Streptomyces virginiae]